MSKLAYRQEKIQEKRKKTPWREFVMEIASWSSIIYRKDWGMISRFPKSDRIGSVIKYIDFSELVHISAPDSLQSKDFFSELSILASIAPFPNMRNVNAENSDYSDTVIYSKNVYLSNTVVNGCENVLYSISIKDFSKI